MSKWGTEYSKFIGQRVASYLNVGVGGENWAETPNNVEPGFYFRTPAGENNQNSDF